jgi:hypothetical protein
MIATCYYCKRVLLPEDKELGCCFNEDDCKAAIKVRREYIRWRQAQGYVS